MYKVRKSILKLYRNITVPIVAIKILDCHERLGQGTKGMDVRVIFRGPIIDATLKRQLAIWAWKIYKRLHQEHESLAISEMRIAFEQRSTLTGVREIVMDSNEGISDFFFVHENFFKACPMDIKRNSHSVDKTINDIAIDVLSRNERVLITFGHEMKQLRNVAEVRRQSRLFVNDKIYENETSHIGEFSADNLNTFSGSPDNNDDLA